MKGYESIAEHLQAYGTLVVHMQTWAEETASVPDRETKCRFDEEWNQIRKKEEETAILLPLLYVRERLALEDDLYWLVLFSCLFEIDGGICLHYRKKYGEQIPDFQYGLHLLSCFLPIGFEIVAGLCTKGHLIWKLFLPGEINGRYVLFYKMILGRGLFSFLITGNILPPEDVCICIIPGKQKYCGIQKATLDKIDKLTEAEISPILLWGRAGSGKKSLFIRLGELRNLPVYILKGKRVYGQMQEERHQAIVDVGLTLSLLPGILVIDCGNLNADEDSCDFLEELLIQLEKGVNSKEQMVCILAEREEQLHMWRRLVTISVKIQENIEGEDVDAVLKHVLQEQERCEWQGTLLGRYRLTIGELVNRLEKIRIYMRYVEYGDENQSEKIKKLWTRTLCEAGEKHIFGQLITGTEGVEEFVGSFEFKERLLKIIRISSGWWHTNSKYSEMKQEDRSGFLLLFYGTSGTGKTMAASILARELAMPLYKVNLSEVFDKYIGETEKHLEKILKTAEDNNYVIFFDEADALFGRRTQINDSHDKYANLSTSFLLQRIEHHMGIVVLATNLLNHFDNAFLRRIRFILKFQQLDAMQREEVWRRALEDAGGMKEEITIEQLARDLPFSAARIKAAVMTANVLATQEMTGGITREQLEWAVRMEAEKDETVVKGF